MTSTSVPLANSPVAAEPLKSELIFDQLQRILTSPAFRNSKRYAAVLRYIVEQTVSGHADQLKERTIGVDVFGRMPDYDTASDHVVRSAMAEVRKRLGQYYADGTSSAEPCIELQPGSYVPQFRFPEVPVKEPATERTRPSAPRGHWVLGALAASAILLVIAFLLRSHGTGTDPLQSFWAPVLNSPRDVSLCIGDLAGGQATDTEPSPVDLRLLSMGDFHRLPSETIHLSDAVSLAHLVSFFGSKNKTWKVVDQTEVNFGDLRDGPAVLIGLMNNSWSKRLLGKARFRAEKVASRRVVIRDSQNPQNTSWAMDYSTPVLNITRDYALIVRVLDPNTDQTVVTAGGISAFGTLAASEFLTDRRSLHELSKIAPGWERKNLEVVLSTEVVRAKSGRPRILAAQVW